MPSYLDHLITDPDAPVTVDFARQCEAVKVATAANVRAARRAELAAGYSRPTQTETPKERAAPCGAGTVREELSAWWDGANDGTAAVTAVIRLAARTFPGVGRADFIATLVSKGVNKATAGIQFKKGREEA